MCPFVPRADGGHHCKSCPRGADFWGWTAAQTGSGKTTTTRGEVLNRYVPEVHDAPEAGRENGLDRDERLSACHVCLRGKTKRRRVKPRDQRAF